MATKVKFAALVLVAAFGIWLTFQSGVEGRLFSSWNCAGSRALICFQR
jgi:hypothetical protein